MRFHRYSITHSTHSFDRQSLIDEELDQIVQVTHSTGETPEYTLSRILQELRDEGIIEFISKGKYIILDTSINIEDEDIK